MITLGSMITAKTIAASEDAIAAASMTSRVNGWVTSHHLSWHESPGLSIV
jgi:hypothetical protein